MPITAEALATLIREIEVEDPIDYGDLPYDEDDLRLLVCNHIREIAEQAAQLGEENRMTVLLAVAAAQLGFKVHIFAPDAESVAAEVTAHHRQAAWDDEPRLAAFAAACDVVTFEFENVSVDTVRFLSGHVAVRPGAKSLEVAQDRLAEKAFVAGL